MSSVAVTDAQAPTAVAQRSEPTTRARVVEFLLTGGATLVLLPSCWLLQRALGLDDAELAVGFVTFYGAHLINDPHFAVTYLLFYRDVRARLFSSELPVAQRLRYAFAGFVAPFALVVWAALSLWVEAGAWLGAMTQLMFALVGWHYVKQSFGMVSVLSARRGTAYSTSERRALLSHCLAGWIYGWASPYDPGRAVDEKGVIYQTLAHPLWLEPLTRAVFWATLLLVAWVLVAKQRREGALPLAPLTGFFSAVWLWTVWSGIDPVFMYLIPALHSVQYLYFVWLLKRNQARAHEGPPSFGRPPGVVLGGLLALSLLLGAVLFHLLPSSLDDALVDQRVAAWSELGPTPYFAAIFTIVNLHHYFMDFVIWRRENAETRYLRV
jgi:hypothetical protein